MDTLPRCAVLAYHKIGEPSPNAWETWFYVPEQVFIDQLRCIRESGWTPIDAETFVLGLERPDSLPRKSVLITFDDGYASVWHIAMPVLAEFGFPAVMFVPTEYIGGSNTFDGGVEPIEPICSWDELRQLEAGGISVQSHSKTHAHLSTLQACEREAELASSKQVLESALDKSVTLFSYPYGDSGPVPGVTAASLVAHGYRAAFLYGGGVATVTASQPFLLPRIAVGPDTDLHAVLNAPLSQDLPTVLASAANAAAQTADHVKKRDS